MKKILVSLMSITLSCNHIPNSTVLTAHCVKPNLDTNPNQEGALAKLQNFCKQFCCYRNISQSNIFLNKTAIQLKNEFQCINNQCKLIGHKIQLFDNERQFINAVYSNIVYNVSYIISLLLEPAKRCTQTETTAININQNPISGQGLLHYAIDCCDVEMFELLLEKLPQLEDVVQSINCQIDYKDLFNKISQSSTDHQLKLSTNQLNARKQAQYRCLFKATIPYHMDAALYCIDKNFIEDWNVKDRYERTLLMYVVASSYPLWSIVLERLLLNSTVIINNEDIDRLNLLDHLRLKYQDIIDKYERQPETFECFYTEKSSDKPFTYNPFPDKQDVINMDMLCPTQKMHIIFNILCKDKETMLNNMLDIRYEEVMQMIKQRPNSLPIMNNVHYQGERFIPLEPSVK